MAAKIFRFLKMVLFYPQTFWRISAWFPSWMRRRWGQRSGVATLSRLLQGTTYLVFGFPATFVITFALGAEGFISLNQRFVAEQADYRLQSDFTTAHREQLLELPGPKTPSLTPVPYGQTEAFRRYLVELYSPVIAQKIGKHPEWDIPAWLDYDGNDNPRDNVLNEVKNRPAPVGIYGELTAETEDSFYLTYSLYHVKDYDHPIREKITHWTFHDNDNEGFHIRVDKQSMEVVEAETWFHNRFLLCNRSNVSKGTEPVHGKMHLENGTHIIIYAQSQGHGVRCAQFADVGDLTKKTKILRFKGSRPGVPARVDSSFQDDVTYELKDFDTWYKYALSPLGTDGTGGGMFEEAIELGSFPDGRPIRIGRFIAGWDYAKGSWSRPKPMWSWDDGWDEIPVFVWHFYPAQSFQSHAGSPVSLKYLHNRPVHKVFGIEPEYLLRNLHLPIEKRNNPKWDLGDHNLGIHHLWKASMMWLKEYVNYLFHALG